MTRHLVALGVAATLGACATMSGPSVPAPIASSDRVVGQAAARGVQIYRCQGASDDNLAWVYTGVEATLMQGSNEIGTIARGPVMTFRDGGKVEATSRAEAAAPGYAIPWRLYDAKSSGGGQFGSVTSVQEINTSGGRAPEGKCSKNQKDITIRVNYTADYVLRAK